MTCIVGLEHGHQVWMGGDSAAVCDEAIVTYREPKVFRLRSPKTKYDFLIGYTSSFRMGQIIKHSFVPPAGIYTVGIEKYLATKFADALRMLLKKKGFHPEDDEGNDKGGSFLIGYGGHLFVVDEDFHVGSIRSSFYALGAGAPVALGALYAARKQDEDDAPLSPDIQCLRALAASAEFCNAVRAPFTVLSL